MYFCLFNILTLLLFGGSQDWQGFLTCALEQSDAPA